MAVGVSAALGRLVGVLGEDALFVLASGPRGARDGLDGLIARRGPAYAAAVQGHPHTRMSGQFDPWLLDMAKALAPVSPPSWLPMMNVVREKVTLEIGARGLRSLFSNKPSDKDVTRVKRYGTIAIRTLRAVLAADGPPDREDQTAVAALISALGLPDADAAALRSEGPTSAEALEVSGPVEPEVARAIVRGAWIAAAEDSIDPREERVVHVVAQKVGVSAEDVETARRDALARVESQRRAGLAAVEGVRYVLSDRVPGAGVMLAALTCQILLPRRWREEALGPVGQGAPVTLAKRHPGLDRDERYTALGVAWAAALIDDPNLGRKALLRARWEKVAQDLGEDDPEPREVVERFMNDALTGVARTLV